jgi:hypothetical protein
MNNNDNKQKNKSNRSRKNISIVDALVQNIRARKTLAEWQAILFEEEERLVHQVRNELLSQPTHRKQQS